MSSRISAGLLLLLVTAGLHPPRAQEAQPVPQPAPVEAVGTMVSATTEEALRPPNPPRLTLVLSGGGARGLAHIGVLQVLDELQIAPDFVIGTSMGSIVGGLYAAGWAPAEIETLLREVKLEEVFSDRVPREDKTFRRKKDDDLLLIPAKIKFKGWKPWMPPAVLSGNRLDLLLGAIERVSNPTADFDDLPIPYRAVATDLRTGEAVVIGEGSLATAMRASMAVPAVFGHVTLNDRALIDGGAVANLPVGIAQALGAERILAVDITSPLVAAGDDASLFTVMNQQSSFLTVGNRLADVARLKPGDVLVVPELGDISFRDFARADEAVEVGRKAARDEEQALRTLPSSSSAWQALLERRRLRATASPVVDEIRVVNSAPVDDEIVRRAVQVPLHEPIDPRTFPRQLMTLSGLDYFGKVDTGFTRSENRGILDVITRPKPYGRNTIQLGLGLDNDFQGDARYALTVRHQTLPLNRRGGEWQNLAQIGTGSGVGSEIYQPLDAGLRWFVTARVGYQRTRTELFEEDQAIAEYRLRTYGGEGAVGRVLGDWGQVRAGVARRNEEATLRVGSPVLPDETENFGGWFAAFEVDTLDTVVFPRHGTRFSWTYTRQADWLGDDGDLAVTAGQLSQAYSFGKNTLVPYVELATTFDDAEASLFSSYRLGGFGRLSGLAEDQLLGTRGGLARLAYYYKWVDLELGALSTRAYAGLTLEAGTTVFEGDPISKEGLTCAGSIFVGAETVIGPAYLAWGRAEGGRSRFYLAIGRQL